LQYQYFIFTNIYMKKSNYLSLFFSLSPKEVRSFSNHINASYSSQKGTIEIYQYYHSLYKRKKTTPSLEIAYRSIFGEPSSKKRPYSKLNNGLSDLFILLKKFLIREKILEKDFESELLWLEILEERELDSMKNSAQKVIENALTKSQIETIWHPLYKLQLNNFIYFKNSNNSEKEVSHLK